MKAWISHVVWMFMTICALFMGVLFLRAGLQLAPGLGKDATLGGAALFLVLSGWTIRNFALTLRWHATDLFVSRHDEQHPLRWTVSRRKAPFSKHIRVAMGRARAHAIERSSSFIDTEDLLHGILDVPRSLGARYLLLEVGNRQAICQLSSAIPPRRMDFLEDTDRFSPLAKTALIEGLWAARKLRHPVITTGHMLYGVWATRGGSGREILRALGFDEDKFWEWLKVPPNLPLERAGSDGRSAPSR